MATKLPMWPASFCRRAGSAPCKALAATVTRLELCRSWTASALVVKNSTWVMVVLADRVTASREIRN